jgi:hypothetical protein
MVAPAVDCQCDVGHGKRAVIVILFNIEAWHVRLIEPGGRMAIQLDPKGANAL